MKIHATILIITLLIATTSFAQKRKKGGNNDMPYIESVRGDQGIQYLADKLLEKGDTAKIAQFIATGISPNGVAEYTNNISILDKALRWHSIATVKCLLDHGADPNLRLRSIQRQMFSGAESYSFSRYPLEAAADANDVDKMQLLVTYGADLNRCLEAVKKIAAEKGNAAMMSWIGQKTGTSAVEKDVLAVMTEFSFEHDASKVTPAIVDDMVAKGADVNAYSPAGKTALLNVIENRQINNSYRIALIKTLLKHGANPNQTDQGRQYPTSPLCAAARLGSLSMVTALVEGGANVNQSNRGDTPLKATNSDEIKEYLILHGAK